MPRKSTLTPATEKQMAFIARLVKEVADFSPLDIAQQDYLTQMKGQEQISKDGASYLISGLLRCDKKPRAMAQPGYYAKQDGTYLVVVTNRAGNATYAKRLDVTKEDGRRAKARWVYAPGEGQEVAHMSPMTLAEAAKFGHLHGVCFVCCRALTDPESVQRGIGPVCATKFGGQKPRPVQVEEKPAAVVVAPTVNVKGRAMRRKKS